MVWNISDSSYKCKCNLWWLLKIIYTFFFNYESQQNTQFGHLRSSVNLFFTLTLIITFSLNTFQICCKSFDDSVFYTYKQVAVGFSSLGSWMFCCDWYLSLSSEGVWWIDDCPPTLLLIHIVFRVAVLFGASHLMGSDFMVLHHAGQTKA